MAGMPLTTPTLRTERLLLRPFDEGDRDDIYALQSDAHVLRFWDSPPWTEPERADRFLASCRTMAEEGTAVRVAVTRLDDGTFLGWCTLHDWNPTFRSAKAGYCFAHASWGHGYATEATRALLTWAYDELDLNRVEASVDTRNPASGRVLEKLGFVLEGTMREDCIVDGVVSDSWVFGLLRREWEAHAAR
jgi:RimJ/RimL family protein N-acetyltransferase